MPLPLNEIIARFDPISLEEMDNVMLQMRMDTKYMFSGSQLSELLEALLPHYRLLEVDGTRGTGYRSRYFDTVGLRHYLDHQNGRTFRSKVRFREYVGSGLSFLEVKRKTGRGGTDKVRLQVDSITENLTPEQEAFVLQASGCSEPLLPMLWNTFSRLTFVHRSRPERLTIDRDLSFSDGNGTVALNGVCVAELKEGRTGHGSPFTALMRKHVIRLSGMSKYCIGMVHLGQGLKHNTFKETLMLVQRLRNATLTP